MWYFIFLANVEVFKGIVYRSTGSWYLVKGDNGEFKECRIKGKIRLKGLKTTNPISVGDTVEFHEEEDCGVIREILPRTNYIIRKSVNLSKQAHIIASNMDQAMLVVTLGSPQTSTGFIDRFLITAEAYSIPVVLVFNKIDLCSEKDTETLAELIDVYEQIGYKCIITSAKQKINIEAVADLLKDKTTMLSGHSGAGKSSLINEIQPDLTLKTGEVSDAHFKGKHTTTFAEMFDLEMGGRIIDTPGIKGFGLLDIEKNELGHYFPEIAERMNDCKFNNCVHVNEPHCAIKSAVEEGHIGVSRFDSYISMYFDDEAENFRTPDY